MSVIFCNELVYLLVCIPSDVVYNFITLQLTLAAFAMFASDFVLRVCWASFTACPLLSHDDADTLRAAMTLYLTAVTENL
jgi:hypothetical protein